VGATRTEPSWLRRLLWGVVIAIGGALVLIVLAETALRVVDYGVDPASFRRTHDDAGVRILRDNPGVTAPYVSRAEIRPPGPFRVPDTKAGQVFRILLLGGSAASGQPAPAFSIARVLEEMLGAAYPELQFEIINAAMPGVNSHVLRGIAEDWVTWQPDVLVVYCGHNEVAGPYGPGATWAPWARSEVALRAVDTWFRSRMGQWHARQGWSWTSGVGEASAQEISLDDPRLLDVRERFVENLRQIARAGQTVGATTLVCTPLANQRDWAPFRSGHRAGLPESTAAEWRRVMAQAEKQADAGEWARAEELYRQALALDDHPADLSFRLARVLSAQGRLDEAKTWYRQAMDRDLLRLRADSRLNQAIRELVAPGLDVVDTASAAALISREEVLGDDLLLDHVHLTWPGSVKVATELYRRVSEELLRRALIPRAAGNGLAENELRRRLAYNDQAKREMLEQLVQQYQLPPLALMPDQAARRQALAQRLVVLHESLEQEDQRRELMQQYQAALVLDPQDWIIRRDFARFLLTQDQPEPALEHLQRVMRWIDDDLPTLRALKDAQQRLGQLAEASSTDTRLRQLEPRRPRSNPAPAR
jgi:tetratricopeptide (TPR) repeat protein